MWNIILAVVMTYVTLTIIGAVLVYDEREYAFKKLFWGWLIIFKPLLVVTYFPLRRIYLINRGVKNLVAKAPNLYKGQEEKLKQAIQRKTDNVNYELTHFAFADYHSFGSLYLEQSIIDWYDDIVEQYGEKKIPLIKWDFNLHL